MYFNVFFHAAERFQDFLIVAEKPHLGLLCTVIAGLSNIVLDALFIYVLNGALQVLLLLPVLEAVGTIYL